MREVYNEYKRDVEEHLLDYLPSAEPPADTIIEAMKYSLTSGGKRLRAVLVLAMCEFCGGDYREALPYACAIEYIHTYSLIHDDLPAMDDDDLRRGIATNHKVFGEGIAILAGDALLNSAFEVMNRNLYMSFDDEEALKRKINACHAITKAAGVSGMIAGQIADIEAENKEASADILKFIHLNKTAALIKGACEAGLYIGNADPATMDNMLDYAEKLGLAFQIADDILDEKGDAEELGKNTGMDRERNKLTYVSLFGIEKSEELLHLLTDEACEAIAGYYDDAEFFRNLVLDLEKRTK